MHEPGAARNSGRQCRYPAVMGRKKRDHDDEAERWGRRRMPPPAIAALAATAVVAAGVSTRVAAKAGYPAPLGLLMLISPLNLVLGIMFAISEWPIERALREARAHAADSGSQTPASP